MPPTIFLTILSLSDINAEMSLFLDISSFWSEKRLVLVNPGQTKPTYISGCSQEKHSVKALLADFAEVYSEVPARGASEAELDTVTNAGVADLLIWGYIT